MSTTRPMFPDKPQRIRVELVVPDGLDSDALDRVRTRMLGVGMVSIGEEILLAAPLPASTERALRAATEDAVARRRRGGAIASMTPVTNLPAAPPADEGDSEPETGETGQGENPDEDGDAGDGDTPTE